LENTEKTLDEIFRDYNTSIFSFKKTGLNIASGIDENDKSFCLNVDFVASINQRSYQKFQGNLCSLLDKTTLKKVSLKISQKEQLPKDLGQKIWNQAGLSTFEADKGNYGFIAFENYCGGSLEYTVYLLPRQIVNQICRKVNEEKYRKEDCLVCSVSIKNQEERERYFFALDELRFYYLDIDNRIF